MTPSDDPAGAATANPPSARGAGAERRYALAQLIAYFLKLGATGFGGPVALCGYMRRDLVERRGWISEADYRDGLALAQLAPGPLAAQLAIYLGYVHYRVLGATLAGIAFVAPSFLMVVAIGWAYLRYGGLAWMQAVFYGVGAAVIGIIAQSAYKLTVREIGRERLLWAIYAVAVGLTAVTETEHVSLFLAAGVLVWLVKAPPRFARRADRTTAAVAALPLALAPPLALADPGLLVRIFGFFAYAGSFVFGSGLAIVPFLYGGVVKQHGWLDDHQFLDAVAVAMITPGPVVITTGFIGYLLAGFAGATVAATATFLPAYLLTIVPAPLFKKHGKRPAVAAFVEGVTTAAIGTITGAVIVLGRRSIVDVPTALVLAVTLALLWKTKVPAPLIVLGAAGLGLALYPGGASSQPGGRAAPAAAAPVCVATPGSLTPAAFTPPVQLPAVHPGPFRPAARDLPLPGRASRFDYQSFDAASGRLYVSHMNDGTLLVFDADSTRVIAEVQGVPRATGVWAVPADHAVWVSAAGRGEAVRVDDRTLRVEARVGGIRFPDGIAYAPEEAKVFVSDEAGEADVVIDARTNAKRATIPLGGEAGNTHYDPVSRCVLVAVQTRNQLVAIDPATERVVQRWDLPGSEEPHGFTLDETGRLAFVTGQGNASLGVVDLRTMRVLQTLSVGRGPDVLAWDPAWRWLYVASESGVVSVFAAEGAALKPIGELSAPHAHTVSIDPRTHRAYLPLEDVGGRPVLRILTP